MAFKKINVEDLNINPMTMIGKEWLLITAGNKENGYNTMTASWGGMGVIWNENVVTVYIRPQRYTKEFVDREDRFTLTVFDDMYKKDLGYLGRVSGKDEDKIVKTSLTPEFYQDTTYFKEAKMVFVCKKLYHSSILPEGFVEARIDEKNYPQKDYHEMYIAKIEEIWVKEKDI